MSHQQRLVLGRTAQLTCSHLHSTLEQLRATQLVQDGGGHSFHTVDLSLLTSLPLQQLRETKRGLAQQLAGLIPINQ